MPKLADILQTGGVTLGVLILLSVLACIVLVERLLATAGMENAAQRGSEQIIRSIYQNHWDEMRALLQRLPASLAPVFQTVMARAAAGKTDLRSALDRQRQMFNRSLRARLWILGTIAAAAPFVGLFGTVIGIMQSFRDIADTGGGGFAVVSRGLSEALITTAAGIVVAVEAVVFFNFLQARLGRIAFAVKIAGDDLLEVLSERTVPSERTGPSDRPATERDAHGNVSASV